MRTCDLRTAHLWLKWMTGKKGSTYIFLKTLSFLVLVSFLKGHGNEADFLGVLQQLVSHRSLTLPFKPFRFWRWIRGDIRHRKTAPWLGESGSRWLSDSASRRVGFWMFKENSPSWGVANSPIRRLGESSPPRLGKSESRHGELGSLYSIFLEFSIKFPNSASRGVVFGLRISPRIWSQNRKGSERSVMDLCQTGLCKNPRKSASLPCLFKWKKRKCFQIS